MRERPDALSSERGFTLIELMAAALVLVVGMLAILSLLHTGLAKNTLNNQRVAATNFTREIAETARQVAYTSLTPANFAAAIQAGGTNMGGGSPWTVKRRNTTYTVDATVCTYDDPADGIATALPQNPCPDNGSSTQVDANGDDFRRFTVNLSWKQDGKTHTFKQSALISNPTGGLGPRIITFAGPSAVITSGNVATFNLTTTFATTVHWNADNGTSQGDAIMVSGNTNWRIDWDLKSIRSPGAIVDGTYSLSAQAYDDRNIAGEMKVASVIINRDIPIAPPGFAGGHDTRDGDWVDFDWSLAPARDIQGYAIFYVGADGTVGTADDRRVCPGAGAAEPIMANTVTSCQDTSPPNGAATYYLVAYDYPTPSSGGLRPGDKSMLTIKAATTRPDPVPSLSASGVDTPVLDWTASPSSDVAFYRVYRDGTTPADRIASPTGTSYEDPGAGTGHTYYVTAVNSDYNESDLVKVVWGTP